VRIQRPPLSGAVAVLAMLLITPMAHAGLFTYQFTGQVTAVDNPNGFFTAPATVGAPVSGFFTYTDTPNAGSFSFNPFFTNYLHFRPFGSPPLATELYLTIGGAGVRSSSSSLTNMIVGDNNPVDGFPPFLPVGDTFRYADQLDEISPLFDFSTADLLQFPWGHIFLVDSTGTAFSSQVLPSGLPLAAFNQRYGVIDIFDDDFEETGRLGFRIDSIQAVRAVPEPSTLALLVAGLAAASSTATLRRKMLARPFGTGDAAPDAAANGGGT